MNVVPGNVHVSPPGERRWLDTDGVPVGRIKAHDNRIGFMRNVELMVEFVPGHGADELKRAIACDSCYLNDGRWRSALPVDYEYEIHDAGAPEAGLLKRL